MTKEKSSRPDWAGHPDIDITFPKNGFLLVGSVYEIFYRKAIECAESIKLFDPDAHVTVYCSKEEWVKPTDWNHADWIVTWEVPDHIRAKLWALAQTPYKGITCYLDADMVCEHEDVKDIFKQLPKDKDLIFTKIRPYNAKITKLTNTEEMTAHCGMFLYRNNKQTLKLMNSWYGEFLYQQDGKNDIGNYPDSVRKWDTFTMWKLLNYSDHGVKWAEDLHCRWNFVNGYQEEELGDQERVMYHYTIPEFEIHSKNQS